jgi:hypothetical protein
MPSKNTKKAKKRLRRQSKKNCPQTKYKLLHGFLTDKITQKVRNVKFYGNFPTYWHEIQQILSYKKRTVAGTIQYKNSTTVAGYVP